MDLQMKKDGRTIIKYRPVSLYLEDYLPKQNVKKRKNNRKK